MNLPIPHSIAPRIRTAALSLLLAGMMVAGLALSPALGQEKKSRPRTRGGRVEMNFKNVEMASFLSIMAAALRLNLVWDEAKIRGNITLVSSRRFKRGAALRIFETVLDMHGLTTVQSPGSPLVQVVPTSDAPRLPSPIGPREGTGRKGAFQTQIIALKFANANQVRAALTPLISKSAGLAIYAPGNVIVISDTAANIRRLVEIIKEMDQPAGDVEFAVLTLKHASARKLAPIITSLAGTLPASRTAPAARGRAAGKARGGTGGGLKVVAEERINALILVGDPLLIQRFRDIVSTLDVPGTVEESGVKVFSLNHADAVELVKILKDVNVKVDKKTPQAAGSVRRAGGPLSNATITADKATNSIIVFGPPEIIEALSQMIAKLDVRRPQVYVEVLIMEMTLEKSLQLGVRWQASDQVNDGIAGAGFPDATPRTTESALASGLGSVIGVIGNEITFGGEAFTSFSGFIQAAQQDQDLNVLANPQLLTLNNQEAEINVSQVVPISTRTVTNTNLQSTTEFEFKDVGIILNITPQITGNNKVRLIIKQESSSIAARQTVENLNQQAITTLQRKLTTQVVVDNDTTMAIGGLIQEQTVETENKIPCLGDIPLLGFLFRSTSEELRKTNLIIFIRPRIIATREDMDAATGRVRERFDRMRSPEADADATLRESFGLPKAPPPDGEDGEEGEKGPEKKD